jgi:hypothetical protein
MAVSAQTKAWHDIPPLLVLYLHYISGSLGRSEIWYCRIADRIREPFSGGRSHRGNRIARPKAKASLYIFWKSISRACPFQNITTNKLSNHCPNQSKLSDHRQTKAKMAPGKIEEPDSDSDSNVEFEDVPIHREGNSRDEDTDIPIVLYQQTWTPTLTLPPQRGEPIPSGSEEETQLRGQISAGLERVTYRKMKSDMGMDAPDTPIAQRRYDSFAQLAADVEGLVDLLWASATRKCTHYTKPSS